MHYRLLRSQLLVIFLFEKYFFSRPLICHFPFFSDTMGNKGAFITMNGKDMKPHFTTYEAVVSLKILFRSKDLLTNVISILLATPGC